MRYTLIAVAAFAGIFLAIPAHMEPTLHAATPHQVDASGQFKAVGWLRKEGVLKNGTPRYALYEDGKLTTHLVPAAGLDLTKYADRRIEVVARSVSYRGDAAPYVLADRISAASSSISTVARPSAEDSYVDLASYRSTAREPHDGAATRNQLQPVGPAPGSHASLSGHRGSDRVRLAAGEESLEAPPGIRSDIPNQLGHDDVTSMEMIPTDMGPTGLDSYDMELMNAGGCATGGSGIDCGAPSCGLPSCGSGGPCGMDGYTWIRADYLFWWTKGVELPPLVTTGVNQTASQAGVLAQPGTSLLLGNQSVLNDQRNGGRFKAGYWRDQGRMVGIEGEYLYLANESFDFSATSTGNPILARPFTNALTGAQDSELVAFPNIVAGTVTAGVESTLHSAGARFRINACCHNTACGGCAQCLPCMVPNTFRFDWLAGYRFMKLDEDLFVREQLQSGLSGLQTNFDLRDDFEAQNTFHGGDLGMLLELSRGPIFLELIGKAALGNTNQQVNIAGSTTTTAAGIPVTEPGGLLALSSNIGQYENDAFSVIPEFAATVGYQLTYRLRLTFGYTFVHWNNVVRVGDQIDTTVNPNLLPPAIANPGEQRPAFAFRETDFWAQGMNFGVDYRW
ncbi:MAG: BBP7 family outer membrane beta-barrel protein [Planctomycetota bacterium]|nr:BBP7 family outer membrane beta-barrel protein [Planctomycetota bacterium]